ncbi:MAG: GGDEF domain-containing protein [Gammaproteobacteria bacterium]|nr:GGDEF domain-containing protein [Gammaproteobacteria bacterium]
MLDLVNLPSSFVKSLNYFNEQLMIDWGLSSRNHLPLSLFVIEIDEFSSFTETYGQSKAGNCLHAVASALNATLRRQSDFIAQLGMHRFMFLANDMNFKQAEQFAKKCHLAIANLEIPHESSPISELVTISIGHATCTPESNNCKGPQAFLTTANKHLNRAIKAGANCSKTALKFTY